MQLTLYGRKDCCLCDEMAGVVAAVAAERGYGLVKVDVDDDPALARAYGDAVPVLCLGERRIVSGRVSERALRALLARHAPS
jgi:CO dehydrogenase nickel-insertion accessory protein CooC1